MAIVRRRELDRLTWRSTDPRDAVSFLPDGSGRALVVSPDRGPRLVDQDGHVRDLDLFSAADDRLYFAALGLMERPGNPWRRQ